MKNRISTNKILGSRLKIGDYIVTWDNLAVRVHELIDHRTTPILCDGKTHKAFTAICSNGYETTVLEDDRISVEATK